MRLILEIPDPDYQNLQAWALAFAAITNDPTWTVKHEILSRVVGYSPPEDTRQELVYDLAIQRLHAGGRVISFRQARQEVEDHERKQRAEQEKER